MKAVRHGERGFTLIELLVVLAILGVLAGIVVPNVSRFVGRGGTEAAQAEVQAIQTAVDVAMADLKLTTVTPQTGVSDFSSAGLKPIATISGTPVYLYPNYVRFARTGGSTIVYAWTDDGLVSQSGSW